MPVTAEEINRLLDQANFPVSRIWIAYSGGVDSHVLLHRCVELRAHLPVIAGAIHIHHGINEQADLWAQHCGKVSEKLEIPIIVRHVELAEGEGVEDRARRARYEAIKAILHPGDVVLLAQHKDDQAETFLLQALRGGGPRGIAAMSGVMPLGEGALARPLLGYSQQAILEYARAHQLEWVEDDSNRELRFERNYLRHEVMPRLKERWPAATKTLARTAAHTASLVRIADELLEDELKDSAGSRQNTLSIRSLRSMSAGRASLLIRALCQKQLLPMPATAHIEELLHKQLLANPDRQIHITWPGAEFRRYQDDLYIQQPIPRLSGGDWQYRWNGKQVLDIPELQGRIMLQPSIGSGIRQSLVRDGLTVRPRRGGERCQPAGDSHRRELKTIYQDSHVPPWERERLPLIYRGDDLLAVADIVVSQQASVSGDEAGYRVIWQSFH